MNPYANLLNKSLVELDEFSLSGEGVNLNREWLDAVRFSLQQAAAASSPGAAENAMNQITRMIVDSGPLNSSFLPSLSQAQIAAEKANKHRH